MSHAQIHFPPNVAWIDTWIAIDHAQVSWSDPRSPIDSANVILTNQVVPTIDNVQTSWTDPRTSIDNPARVAFSTAPTVSKRAVLSQVDGKKRSFTFPYSPLQMRFERRAIQYNEIERPGRKPLLEAKQYQLRQVSFDAVLVDRADPINGYVGEPMGALSAIAREDTDLRFSYDASVKSIVWRLSELSFEVARRNNANQPSLVVASITLTETSKILNKVVPGMDRIAIPFTSIGGENNNAPTSSVVTNGPDPWSYSEQAEPST